MFIMCWPGVLARYSHSRTQANRVADILNVGFSGRRKENTGRFCLIVKCSGLEVTHITSFHNLLARSSHRAGPSHQGSMCSERGQLHILGVNIKDYHLILVLVTLVGLPG